MSILSSRVPVLLFAVVALLLSVTPASAQFFGGGGSVGDAFLPGTARLVYTSSTTLTLNAGVLPIKVGALWVARVASGQTCSNAGLAASTLYYVYFSDSAGTLTCELSATGHVTDASYGVQVKSGDATRTLAGMIKTNGSTPGQFSDFLTLSYFARRLKSNVTAFTDNRTATGTTPAEVHTEIRNTFITWADEAITIALSGSCGAGSGNYGVAQLGIDNATPLAGNAHSVCGPTSTISAAAVVVIVTGIPEASHYVTVLGSNDTGGTTTFYGSNAKWYNTVLTVGVQG